MKNLRKLFADSGRRGVSFVASICAAVIAVTGSAFAVTPEELMGDYTLIGIDINYSGSFPPAIDENDFLTVSGYLSATTAALVYEHAGQDNVNRNIYRHITAGTYQISGNSLSVVRADGGAVAVQISMPNEDTVVMTGVGRDSNDQLYNYAYRYSRDTVYFTQEALDGAIESATDGLYTQEELDSAVEDALSNVKPRVVPIILAD